MRFAFAVLLLLACGAARAVCPLDPPHVYVGDTASDAFCTYNDIQSALNAANSTCPTQVDVTREHLYGAQSLTIAGKRVILQGWGDGVTCYSLSQCGPLCDRPNSTVALVELDGFNAPGRVLTITGNSVVTLRNLRVMRGDAGGGSGGGILYNGFGFLNLESSDVLLNTAAYGGGINVIGNGGTAALQLFANSQILNNTAGVSGGGIRLEGTARLVATKAQTWIGYNHANAGYGGGVEVIAPARADIGSGGYNGTGVVSYNDAVDGGGISINANANSATVRLFTTDPANPVLIENNVASDRGGGVYLGMTDFPGGILCGYDFRIDANQASDGAAIYADYDPGVFTDTGSEVHLNTGLSNSPSCGPETLPSLGAVDCAPGVPCSEIARNVAANVNAQPTDGAVVTLATTSQLEADPVAFRGNNAANILRLGGGTYPGAFDAILRNCLIAGNHTQHELISVRGGRDIGINGCTIAANTIDNGYSIYANAGDQGLRLVNSIIDQPGRLALDYVGDNALRSLSYLIANETMTLGGATYSQGNTPVYVDPANGDFHLAPNSPGVDYAPAQGGYDLDGKPRTVDLPAKPNLSGARDLGAYERQDGAVIDELFQDGFE
jgi:hypothetical protein